MALDAFAYVQDLLRDYGLEELADWAWDKVSHGSTGEQVIQDLRTTQTYLNRFKGMAERQAKGLPAISEGEYINYERQARQLMRDAGMPEGFWDQPDDFAHLIGVDKSINELNQQITGAYRRVAQAPPEVRDYFGNTFGPSGETALAAFFLDPDRTTPYLERAVTTAEIGGTGSRFGIPVSAVMADRLASIGVTLQSAQQGFGQIGEMGELFNESVVEQPDLAAGTTGVGAVFGVDTTSAAQLRQRKDERAARFGGNARQAGITQTGATGLGSVQEY